MLIIVDIKNIHLNYFLEEKWKKNIPFVPLKNSPAWHSCLKEFNAKYF